ncbi:FliM/FliN family flagellar motor switch protein [Herbaspirillum sp. LeCh32-8]|uniref:FliM/FliN family flagellar motor switch protein n=1 Tax=Herbaspirillum sp. LeCh32-8 TaxID=2821356 RepID=UPI001AE30191|nr:FliM/FliN family flagellar motor switch protein [Herbaspirillum sp. LeCh32-8]MBP0597312.1 FliM/FliN family flagellar motor switch protein [Herbaspirillum sp. LeCh32-8]
MSRLLGRGMHMALGPDELQCLVLPASPQAADHMVPDLRLQTAHGALLLAQGERLLAALTGIDPGAGRAADGEFAPWLAAALAGRLQHTPLAGLRAVQACTAVAVDDAGLVGLRLRLRDASHAIETMAWATPALWISLLAAAEPILMPLSDWLRLPCAVTATLATHRLPLSAFDALRCGDLLLPTRPCFDVHGNGRLTLGARRWRVRYVDHQRLQILSQENALTHDTDLAQPPEELDAEIADDASDALAAAGDDADQALQPAAGDPEVDHGAAQLQLTLHFELGRLRLSLAQLRALGEHAVLDLHGADAQSIAITSAGVEVGRGEVVSVDGRLGVRLTRWSGAC